MAIYTGVEFGILDTVTNEVVKTGTTTIRKSTNTAAIIRFTGLPINRDTFPSYNDPLILRIGAAFSDSPGVIAYIEPVLNSVYPLPTTPAVLNPAWRLEGVAAPIVFESGNRTDIDSVGLSGAFVNQSWAAPISDGTFGITFVLRHSELGGLGDFTFITTSAGTTLTVVEQSGRTGLAGQRYIEDGERPRGTGGLVCPKSGRWLARTEAVRDGYTGALVDPRSYDPPEPKHLPRGWMGERDEPEDL